MKWSNPYIGIPDLAKGRTRDGADCAGILILVYREVLGIELPDYTSEYLDDRAKADVGSILAREKSKHWRKVDDPKEFDVMLFEIGEVECHLGIYCAPGQMLHTVEDDHAKIGRYDLPPWRDRLVGFYRWIG